MSFVIWDKTSNLMNPDGIVMTPEDVLREYPFTQHVPAVLEMTGPVMVGIDNIYTICAVFGIDESLSVEGKLERLKAAFWRNRNPQLAEQLDVLNIITGEDASQLDHQGLMQKAEEVRVEIEVGSSSADIDLVLDILEGKV